MGGDPREKLRAAIAEMTRLRDELDKLTGKTREWKTEVKEIGDLEARIKPDYTGFDALAGLARNRAEAEQEAFLSVRRGTEQELEQFRRLYEERKITAQQYAEARVDIEAIATARVLAEVKKETEAIAQQFAPFRSVIENSLSDPLRDAFDGNLQSVSTYFKKMLSGFALAIQQALILKPLLDALQNKIGGPGGPIGFLNALGLKGFGQSTTDLGSAANGGWSTTTTPFGGFFAEGGDMQPGRRYRVGEKGAEDFVPSVPGFMIPKGGSRGGSSYTYAPMIDARNADIGAADRLEAVLAAAAMRQREQMQLQASTRRRFPTRRD
jgi:hypothetical protein